MKRIPFGICLVLLGAAVFAADYGVVLDNLSGWSSSEGGETLQRDRATAWFATPLAAGVDLYASFRLDYYLTPEPSWFGLTNYGFDIGRFDFLAAFPGNAANPMSWSIGGGRFQYTIQNGTIFSGRLDGLNAKIDTRGTTYRFALGYLGLMPKIDTRTLLSADDIADYDDDAVFFAPPRLVLDAELTLVELFARQDLSIGISSQFDFRGLASTEPNEIVHSQYLSFILAGSLGRNIFHSAHADLGIGESNRGILVMVAAGYSVSYYIPELARARLELLVDYASGKTGFLSIWRPISQRQMGFVYNVSFADCLSVTLDASITPLNFLTLGIKGSPFLRTSTQALSDTMFDTASTDSYLGTEADLYAIFRPGSDFTLSAAFGVFLPAAGLSYLPGAAPRWLVSATATLSL
jgi:hypothetical protein